MLIVLSPAKSLNLDPIDQESHSLPVLKSDAYKLSKLLKTKSTDDLRKMMNISEQLASDNFDRFKRFRATHHINNSKRAINTFDGDVYRGLNVNDFEEQDYEYAQKHLRILSGLYGVLRPLDLIQPYRLEMGSSIKTEKGNSLYAYWGNKITNKINLSLRETNSKLLINLASDEYFKAINNKKLKASVLKLNFKEWREGQLKFLSYSAKLARGMMARYIIKNKIEKSEDIKGFDSEGYYFSHENSYDSEWLFVR